MFSDAKVGDRVFDYTLQEWGFVAYVYPDLIYCLEVKFSDRVHFYTKDGLADLKNKVPTLFWDEVKPIIPPEKPLPKLEIDTPVLVWSSNTNHKYKRYFSHFDSKGNIHCFKSGTTSWSTCGKTTEWKHWGLVE